MKRIFLFKTLLLCLIILILFYPQNKLSSVQKKDKVLTIIPGEPVKKQFVLSRSNKEIVNFVINTAGRMALKAEWTGNAKTLIVILYKPGYAQVIRKEGRSPVIIEYNVSPDMVSQNNTWRVSLAKFSSKTSATGNISIFQEETSKPESSAQINETTKIKDYQLMEEPEKELPEIPSVKDTIRDETGGQVEGEDESPEKEVEETDLKLAQTKIEKLRSTSRVFKELAGEPLPDSLNQQEVAEAEKYNKWLIEKSEEMNMLGDKWEKSLDNTSNRTEDKQDVEKDYYEQYFELSRQMQEKNRQFNFRSNIMKNKHDTAKNSINNIR